MKIYVKVITDVWLTCTLASSDDIFTNWPKHDGIYSSRLLHKPLPWRDLNTKDLCKTWKWYGTSPLTVHLQVVMIFIPNDQKCLLLFTLASIFPMKGTLAVNNTRKGFMLKEQSIWHLPLHIVKLASYPGAWKIGELRAPGIHCLCMRVKIHYIFCIICWDM